MEALTPAGLLSAVLKGALCGDVARGKETQAREVLSAVLNLQRPGMRAAGSSSGSLILAGLLSRIPYPFLVKSDFPSASSHARFILESTLLVSSSSGWT